MKKFSLISMMTTQNPPKFGILLMNIFKVFVWILVLPAVFCSQIITILIFEFILARIGITDQVIPVIVRSFIGNFLFIFFAGLWAPSKKQIIVKVTFGITVFSIISSFFLSYFGNNVYGGIQPTSISDFVFQILGASYSFVIISSFFAPQGFILEQLWRKIITLGVAIILLGSILIITGIVVGIVTTIWATLFLGVIVFCVGVLTELFPYIHMWLRAVAMSIKYN